MTHPEIEIADLFPPPLASVRESFDGKARVVVLEGDCRKTLLTIPDGSIRLVVTSPPYNIGKDYESAASLSEYLKSMEPVLGELWRVLADDGSVCWQVGNFVDKGEIVPLDIAYYPLFKTLGFQLRNRIVWHFDHGLHASRRFSGRYETILWFTKSSDYLFNLDAVRVPSKYPGKTHFKGAKRGLPSGNPLGKNPSDYWKVVEQDWDRLVWEIPNVKANHPEKTEHPCQFPIELVQRCVLALSNEDDFVLDPFAGAGSTLLGALLLNRRTVACEKEPKYIALMKSRLDQYHTGELRIRPLGKPVHKPSGREKVSRIPTLWDSNNKDGQ